MLNADELKALLRQVADGELAVEDAELAIRSVSGKGFVDLGYAKADTHRRLRQGFAEVIFGQGKTAEQIIGIMQALRENERLIIASRVDAQKAAEVAAATGAEYHEAARMLVLGALPEGSGKVVVASGGTADHPVAEEAALTAHALGAKVVRIFDVGVAGLHRLQAFTKEFLTANAIVAVAGMEGALPSVVAGLTDRPVFAVPTSVGYGANFGGISALLAMLNSCASGVSVLNIDNGFGGGYMAATVNSLIENRN